VKSLDWLLDALTAEPLHHRELAKSAAERARMQRPFDELGKLLAALCLPTAPATPRIRSMVRRAWELITSKAVPVVCAVSLDGGEQVPCIVMGIGDVDGALSARIFLPLDYAEQVDANPVLQLGLLVYVLSQAVAFVDGRETGDPLQALGEAYHAEYLGVVRRWAPRYPLSQYQQGHLRRWPRGLDSPGAAEPLDDPPPTVRA
jgi:hypothetical protein